MGPGRSIDLGDASDARAGLIWIGLGNTLWRVVDLTINVHHHKLQFVILRFDIRIRDGIKFNIQCPAPLDIIHTLGDQGTLLKWRVVFF